MTQNPAHRWWFDSGALAIDFAYSGAFAHTPDFGEHPDWESIHTEQDLAEWLGERFIEFDGSVNDRELLDARNLRGAIARAVLATSRGEHPASADVDLINLYAATPDIPPVLAGGSRQAGRRTARVGQTLSEMARQAVDLLSDENRERIRECSASDCHIVFYDESRSNNRRWCSMARCGNRAKVRKHRAAKS